MAHCTTITPDRLAELVFTSYILPHIHNTSRTSQLIALREAVYRLNFHPILLDYLTRNLATGFISFKHVDDLIVSALGFLGFN